MAGEDLPAVEINGRGLAMDRWFAVEDGDGRFAAGKDTARFRRRDAVYCYSAAVAGETVTVRRDGREWTAGQQALDQELSAAMGAAVRVLPESTVPHQDAAPVSLIGTASLQWCIDNLGVAADSRRLRANLLFEADQPFVEESWIGSDLRIGTAVLRPSQQITRCRVIDLAQDGVKTVTPWLKALGGERRLCMGIYADVVAPGRVALGDRIQIC